MSATEQIILTVSANGYGKRTSSYEYRITRTRRQRHCRDGGQPKKWPARGLHAVEMATRSCSSPNGAPIESAVLSMASRVAGRGTQGVIVFDTAEAEQVVAVERITEEDTPRRRRRGTAGRGRERRRPAPDDDKHAP